MVIYIENIRSFPLPKGNFIMKLVKFTCVFVCFVLLFSVFAGCSRNNSDDSSNPPEESKAVNSDTVSDTVSDAVSDTVSQSDPVIDWEDPEFIIFDYRDTADVFDDALDEFFRDETYVYYFSATPMHEYVMVEYADGTTQNVKDALADGRITIADLDRFNIGYYKEPAAQ